MFTLRVADLNVVDASFHLSALALEEVDSEAESEVKAAEDGDVVSMAPVESGLLSTHRLSQTLGVEQRFERLALARLTDSHERLGATVQRRWRRVVSEYFAKLWLNAELHIGSKRLNEHLHSVQILVLVHQRLVVEGD